MSTMINGAEFAALLCSPRCEQALTDMALQAIGLDSEIYEMLKAVRAGTPIFRGTAKYLIRKRYAKRTDAGFVLTCYGLTLLEGAEIQVGYCKVIDITMKRRAQRAGG